VNVLVGQETIPAVETVHVVILAGSPQRGLEPSGLDVPVVSSVKDVSDPLQPNPETVTGVPVGPWPTESETVAPLTVKVFDIKPWTTKGLEALSVIVTVYGISLALLSTVKLPVRNPWESIVQLILPEPDEGHNKCVPS
jgi:hypothetical protein